MALTRKNRGGNKMMNNCKEKYCKKYTEKNGKIIKDLITFFEKLPNKTKKQQALVKKMKTKMIFGGIGGGVAIIGLILGLLVIH